MKSLVLFAVGAAMSAAFAQEEFDVVIYGSSPAALTAAIAAPALIVLVGRQKNCRSE